MTLRLVLVLFLAAQVAAVAQQAPVTIHGRVLEADTRAALPRARVTLIVNRDSGSPVYTNERGEFSIAAPSAATFTLSVVKAGFAAVQMPLQKKSFDVATVPEVAVALTRSAAVNGRVVDTNGETLVGLRIYADRLDPDPGSPSVPVKFATTTDDRGEYRIGGLPPGRYSVTAVGAQDPDAVVTLDLRSGDDVSSIGFTALPPPESAMESTPQPPETPEQATIRGRVLTTSGSPVAEAIVNLKGPTTPRFFRTDAKGRFAFTGVIPGEYEVVATKGEFLPGTLSQRTAFELSSRISVTDRERVNNVTLVLSRGSAVTGTIVDTAGEPLQGLSVVALQLGINGDRRRAVLAGASLGGDRQTDDRGRYRVLGLEPGTYIIAALADATSFGASAAQSVPFYFPGSASIADAATVTITSTDVEGIDFAVADVPTPRVTGVALDSTGAPLRGTITLAVSHRSGSIVPHSRTTQPDGKGAFAFYNVAPGDYVVQAVRLPIEGEVLRNPNVGPLEALEFAAQYVTVGAQDAEPVSLRATRGAIVEARIVTDADVPDNPYERIQIEGHPVGFDMAPLSFSSAGIVSRRVNGRARIGGLTGPRRFALSGVPDGWYLKSLTIDGSDVTDRVVDFGIGAGATLSAEAVISSKGGSIAGRITSEGRTAAGSSVVVFPQDREKWFERSRFIKVVRASQQGSFRAGSLPPGDYYVAVTSKPPETATREMLESLLSRAVAVTLDEGEERKVELSR